MLSTMQDFPLTITHLLRHGRDTFPDSEIITYQGPDQPSARRTFADTARRCDRLAVALTRLGVGAGDRVGTFLWNNQEHHEAYFAVPCMGAVLHTLNVRLFAEQLVYVVNHGADKVVIVDGSLVPAVAALASQWTTVEHYVVTGPDSVDIGPLEAATGAAVHRYEALLADAPEPFDWPQLDERSAAAMCYTSGTTGNPKGVVYSHRSTFVHALVVNTAGALALTERDRFLCIVPMFHANAWGAPYAGWIAGCDIVHPQRWLQAEPLAAMISGEHVTVSSGVPTIWNDLLTYADSHPVDLSSLRSVTAGGSAPPAALIERFRERLGVEMVQGWGMTETSPVASLAIPPRQVEPGDELRWRATAGRVVPAVEVRVVDADTGAVLANDGAALGEFEIRGPYITGSYYGDPSPERFHDGWLRTGDMGTLDRYNFMRISDRTKDVIKSGGEWVSSVDLENAIMGHPAVLEAAVIGVPDVKWGERPLACVVVRPGAAATPDELKAWLDGRVAKWWIPESWAFIDAVPRTSVGKFDKKALRATVAEEHAST